MDLEATAETGAHGATVTIDGSSLDIEDVVKVARENATVQLDDRALKDVERARQMVEESISDGKIVYGINTGFGEMVHRLVPGDGLEELQENLILSHTANVGDAFRRDQVRAMLLARANCLVKGGSGVRPDTLKQLVRILNEGYTPIVPRLGSVGASGDLGPLSHIACVLIGEGEALDPEGNRIAGNQVLEEIGIEPIELTAKEGLSLINGTSAMTGVMCLALHDAEELIYSAEIATALSVEVMRAPMRAYDDNGNQAKNHPGQVENAANERKFFEGTELAREHEEIHAKLEEAVEEDELVDTEEYLQHAYTLRCSPQVLGTTRDGLMFARKLVTRELNGVNDNPIAFPEAGKFFHGTNFHGQPVALAADVLATAMCQVGVLSDRRIERLLDPKLNKILPEFLISNDPGLRCGFAGAQYTATSLVAENRVLSTPASIQSIPSNGSNQDVVSMGLIAARQAAEIIEKTHYIVGLELLAGCQAADHHGPEKLGQGTQSAYDFVRAHVPPLDEDRIMSDDIETVADLLGDGGLNERVREAIQER